MLGKVAGDILAKGISALAADANNERNKIGVKFKKIASHPLKVMSSFLAAPFLVLKIAMTVKNPTRRVIAIIGLMLSCGLSYVAATFLGTLVGALFVASHIGILAGIGFILGTTLSVYLSVIFLIIVFNAVSFIFLKVSSQEVLDYLNEIST